MALLSAKKLKKPAAKPASSDEADADSDGGSNCSESKGNAGWAASILKVLNTTKPKSENRIVLARGKRSLGTRTKKDADKKKGFGFEIEGAEVKNEESDDELMPDTSALDAHLTRQQRKNVPLQLRVKPSFKEMDRERSLRKVATRGVVQFYNAVRIQQKDLKQQLAEAGPLDSRQDAVLNNINKRKFLDVLMSGKRAKSEAIDNSVKNEETESEDDDDVAPAAGSKKKSEWSVLREDFMTNKKIKHWDEEDEDDASDDANGNNKDDESETNDDDEDDS